MRNGSRYSSDDPRVIACQTAIRAAGGQTRLAEALGIKHQAVYGWEIVPAERCLQVSSLSGVSVHELRPDVFGTAPKLWAAPG